MDKNLHIAGFAGAITIELDGPAVSWLRRVIVEVKKRWLVIG
jgi:hypothetical protein